jgi:serine/threonine protein kinase
MSERTITPSGNASAELALVIERLNARLEAGEPVDVEEVLRQYPEHAAELRELLPAMALLVNLSRSTVHGSIARDENGALLGELGDYRLIREVGRGGMGVVYEAEQISLGRRVALKVLPFAATMDPRQLQRFKNEAKAAASLRHENIVHVYGVGCERGVHYYAMEFIDGLTLAHVIARRAGPRERPVDSPASVTVPYHRALTRPRSPDEPTAPAAALATERGPKGRDFYRTAAGLIAQAADALEHAHSFGIVHRDVKPANLLLDAAGKLYVSDFGLARFGSDAGLTMTGDLLGTLRYMAPEQALAKHNLVDHRADVYGLGATLYELLTGRPAVDGADKQEVLRRIAFEDPAPPRKHDGAIPVELETIALKAPAKDPAERYPSAAELADDLRRWLGHQTIRARRPSLRQRLDKWVRRHSAAVAAAAAALLVGLGLSTWLAVKARDAERQATTEAAIARAVSNFLQEDLLKQAKNAPEDEVGPNGNPNLTVREALDRASAKVAERFGDQPVVEAAIRVAIGEAYASLDESRLTAKHLERAVKLCHAHLGPDHSETLRAMRLLADTYTWIGRAPDAIVLHEQLLENIKTRLGPDDSAVLDQMNTLARAYRRAGDWKRAMQLLEQVIEKDKALRGPIAAGASDSAQVLAMIYQDAGMYLESAARLEQVFEHRKLLGSDPDDMLASGDGRAHAYQLAGKLDQADRLLRRKLELQRKRVDSCGQIRQARTLEFLILNLLLQDRPAEAEPLAREALALYEKNHTTDREWRRPYVMNLLGGALLGQKKYADAEPLLLQGYEGMKQAEATLVVPWRYRLTEAGERVIRYYEATNQPEKARTWREKIATLRPADHSP